MTLAEEMEHKFKTAYKLAREEKEHLKTKRSHEDCFILNKERRASGVQSTLGGGRQIMGAAW